MTITGTIVNGQVHLDHPADLPDETLVDLTPRDDDEARFVPPPSETYAQHIAILRESIAAMEAGDPCLTLEEVRASMSVKLVALGALPEG